MPLRAGELDQKVQLLRSAPTVDAAGGEVPGWVQIGQRWCSVRYGTGQERREAGQERASLAATFRMRRDSLTSVLTPKHALRHMDSDWDITSAAPFERDAIDITAVRRSDQED